MAMSSYEVVRRAIEFDHPDRLPVMIAALGLNDVHGVGWNQIGTGDRTQRQTLDEWQCLWVRSETYNMGQVKGHPLADWSAWDTYPWPDPANPAFYEGMEGRIAGSEGKYVMTGIFMLLFERMHTLHGFESTLMELYTDPERLAKLADRIVEIDLGLIDQIDRRFGRRIHGLSFTDDWGTQEASFVSPALWDRFFKPRYKLLFDRIHRAGWHVWMHSCGKVNALLPSLIDIGLDVINLQQPKALGIREVGERFAGQICFQSLCDIQHTLPYASPAEIRAEAQELLAYWGTASGGFILSDYGDDEAIGVQMGTKQIMLDAFLAADRWKGQQR